MRLQVEVRNEDEELLRHMAIDGHRSVREQAGYLLHLKIHEECARLNMFGSPPIEPVAEVA